MISILTPRYVKSEWCVREVNEFYAACENNLGFTIQNKARIFKIAVRVPAALPKRRLTTSGMVIAIVRLIFGAK